MSDKNKKKKSREERAEFTNGEGGLAPLSWGRLKIAKRCIPELEMEDDTVGGDIAAALYLMPFSQLKSLLPQDFLAGCAKFALKLEASRVLLAVKAFERDMGAFEASEVSPAGKQGIVEEDQEQEEQEQSLSSKQVSITQL